MDPSPKPWRTAASRLAADSAARYVVTGGGITVIAAIMAIMLVIAIETMPLFFAAKAAILGGGLSDPGGAVLALGADEHRSHIYSVTKDGIRVETIDGEPVAMDNLLPDLEGAQIIAASEPRHGHFALGLSDGRVLPVSVDFKISFDENTNRIVVPSIEYEDFIPMAEPGEGINKLAWVFSEGVRVAAVAAADGKLKIEKLIIEESDFGGGDVEEYEQEFEEGWEGQITSLAADDRGDDLIVGTSSGKMYRVDLRDPEDMAFSGVAIAGSRLSDPVTALGYVFGGLTLVAGAESGRVSTWQILRRESGGFGFVHMYDYEPHDAPVIAFAPSLRNKSFLTADAQGSVHLNHGTTGKTQWEGENVISEVSALAFAPKYDGFLVAGSSGAIQNWALDDPHPEVSWSTLFGKVQYEGYTEAAYSWQSSSASQDFEPKFSLTPLIFGTLKGTFYALLFAVPIALMAALYASQFMNPGLKSYLKPTIEIMAAVPSVVIGFLAGLWLAPVLEGVVPAVLGAFVVFPVVILSGFFAWQKAPVAWKRLVPAGREMYLVLPLVFVGTLIAIGFGALIESSLMGGDFREWLLSAMGVNYDQRNSLVIGIAMGFAVIPIIFTIAEDAITNVPPHLGAGSLALGATPWQTAIRIVMPTASPGVFSAIMIGLGRAVGETMIVLMATGNTPIMDLSIFNGFRALSATIAVELPEAPHGGTHYRVLFLMALILFIMTFFVNTAAEAIRLRLRKKYQAYA
ncbi:MAG: ABC transporter permease subunit [Chrysiogenetes bacterium]|nr:ABC transporter permease subunit [Chrysiogenetes bacterium]